MMFNADGELLVCEGAAFRVVVFDTATRMKRVLLGDGPRQFNEPNDLAVDRQGRFYFTDPNYKHGGQQPIKKQDVYYCSPQGEVRRVSDVCQTPNGAKVYTRQGKPVGAIDTAYGVDYASNCCFGGPDFSTLYITSRDKFLGLSTKAHGREPLPLQK